MTKGCNEIIIKAQNMTNTNTKNENKNIDYHIKTTVPTSEIVADWVMPCEGRISSPYGWRIHPIKKEKIFHNGIDIAVPIGTPIKAIYDGKVIRSGISQGYGYSVVIEHNINGKIYTSEYGHILNPKILNGTTVKRGDIIAYSGNEGASKGPHLHLTIRIGKYRGQADDPAKFLIDLRN